jgi:glycosyltransferase involved in cell wall biosynthesis
MIQARQHPFIYATRSIIPSGSANAIQSANMACAFSNLFESFSTVFRSPCRLEDLPAVFAGFELPPPRNPHLIAVRPATDWSNLYLTGYAAWLRRQPATSVVYTRSGKVGWVAASLGFKTIVELHDPLIIPYALWLRRRRRLEPGLKVVATTERLKADVIEKTGLSEAGILVAGGAANPALLTVPALEPQRRFAFNAGYAGSAFKGKGLEILAACASRMPDVGFHVIGPSGEDCRPYGLAGANVLVYGRKTNREAIGLLKSMDCLLLPNQRSVIIRSGADIGRHTSPLKMFEYMATGRPVIASDLPVLSGTLQNNVNALLCPPEDVDGFCAHISALRQNPDLGRRLGARARVDFEARYTWPVRAKAIHDFIYS